jgi:hypothetical protein
VTPEAAQHLSKLLGMLGSNSDNERAVVGRMADQFLKSAGLRWSDIILPAEPKCQRADWWRVMVNYCFAHRGELFGKSREFVENMHKRDRQPTDKQLEWLASIYHRLRKGEA